LAKGDILTVTLSGSLNAEQEPGPTSDSKATGDATVVITQNLATEEVSCSSELSVVGRAALNLVPGQPADLFVNTGERAVIAYLAQPVSEGLARTFIE
jgi:hypothetical protein